MVKISIDEIKELMNKPDFIRNICVIAHVSHGKTTMMDTLIARAGIIPQKISGTKRFMDSREDEQKRGLTIKSAAISLHFKYNEHEHLFNFVDSPGHVDFSSEVTASLRITDGALVLVDSVEGVCVQTETVMRMALQEKVKPVLFINKLDRALIDLNMDGEAIYKNYQRCIERANVIIASHGITDMGNLELDPTLGNVAFGSGKEGWGFTLHRFAEIYSKKFGIDVDKMVHKLWGDNFFDAKHHCWKHEEIDVDGNPLKRAFVMFVLEPIAKVAKTCADGNQENIDKLLKAINVELEFEERKETGRKLAKNILQKWMDITNSLLEMMVTQLPSPKQAQKYRTRYLYESTPDDPCYVAMANCDAKGPLMVYISKMIPTSDKSRFYAFGRVFSGTLSMGQKVHVFGPTHVKGRKSSIHDETVQRTALMMGPGSEQVHEIPAGNLCAVVGIDQGLGKSGTLTDNYEAGHIKALKHNISPVVRVAVKPKNPSELPKLILGMQRLSKSDPLVVCINDEETGENIIAGSGQLHIEICIHDLIDEFAQIEIIKSDPVVAYRETVREKSKTALSKSANHQNRLYCTCEPISQELTEAIEAGEIPILDSKETFKVLTERFDWDKNSAMRLWSFGPKSEGPNVIVDETSGCQFMHEIREHMISGFEIVAKSGVLCEEPLRGVRFNVVDTLLHSDSIHRGGGQITPCTRRVLYAAELMSNPTLQEPIFQVLITCPLELVGGVYSCMGIKRGSVEEETPLEGTDLVLLRAFLPVAESFDFATVLREKTGGNAFPNCTFDHWSMLDGNALDPQNKLHKLICGIRVRKGLKEEIPLLSNYLDKL